MIPQDSLFREVMGTCKYVNLRSGVTSTTKAKLESDSGSGDLATEDIRESRSGDLGHFGQLNLPPDKTGKRGNSFIGYAARNDHFEVTEIGVYVQRESVAGDPTGDPYSNCPDLFSTDRK